MISLRLLFTSSVHLAHVVFPGVGICWIGAAATPLILHGRSCSARLDHLFDVSLALALSWPLHAALLDAKYLVLHVRKTKDSDLGELASLLDRWSNLTYSRTLPASPGIACLHVMWKFSELAHMGKVVNSR